MDVDGKTRSGKRTWDLFLVEAQEVRGVDQTSKDLVNIKKFMDFNKLYSQNEFNSAEWFAFGYSITRMRLR